MSQLGLTLDDLDQTAVEVWPENMPILDVYRAMMTQWRMGFNGPIGLDYNVLPFVMRTARIPRDEWQDVFDGVRVAEAVTLEMWNKER